MQMSASDAWLNHVAGRLRGDSFEPLPPHDYQPAGFKFAVRRTRFELTKFGMSETFFVFSDIAGLNPQAMGAFSSAAFRLAIRSKSVPLPCGLFESVWCYAVAITNNVDPRMSQFIRDAAPQKHWAAAEIPVVFDTTTGQICYFEKTPLWGAAYYAGFRREIQRYLS